MVQTMSKTSPKICYLDLNIDRIILPLDHNYASTGDLLIKIGDSVYKNQALTKSIKNDNYSISIHSPIDGYISNIDYYPVLNQSSEYKTLAVEIQKAIKDNLIEKIEKSAPVPLIETLDMSHQQLQEKIKQAGIIGLGGAGFPSAQKLVNTKIDKLIINAVECEAPIDVDNCLIQNKAEEIISGIILLKQIYSPNDITIALKSNMLAAKQSLESVINKSSKSIDNLTIKLINNQYPSGYSKSLIKIITNKNINLKQHSSEENIICLNIGTVFAIQQAVYFHQPLIERLVTITGDISQPGNYLLPIGTPIISILKYFNVKLEQVKTKLHSLSIRVGGDFMGVTIFDSQKNNSLEQYYYLNKVGIEKTTQAIHISYKINTVKNHVKPIYNCIRCGLCDQICPINLLPQQLYWHSSNIEDHNKQDLLQQHNIANCIECGLCDSVCPSNIPLAAKFKFTKSKIKLNSNHANRARLAEARNQLQNQRTAIKEQEKYTTSAKIIKSSKKNKKDLLASALKRAQTKKINTNQKSDA